MRHDTCKKEKKNNTYTDFMIPALFLQTRKADIVKDFHFNENNLQRTARSAGCSDLLTRAHSRKSRSVLSPFMARSGLQVHRIINFVFKFIEQVDEKAISKKKRRHSNN